MSGRVMALYGMIFRAGPAVGAVLMGTLSEYVRPGEGRFTQPTAGRAGVSAGTGLHAAKPSFKRATGSVAWPEILSLMARLRAPPAPA
jgi:hypothetical protein